MNGTNQLRPTTSGERAQGWSLAASAGSIVSAFVASLCCIGPLVFALLGIGGAGLLVKFEPYRPLFMGVTLALLGTGFYVTYRKPKYAVSSGPNCDCPAPKTNLAGRLMLWVATVLAVGILSFPYFAGWVWG